MQDFNLHAPCGANKQKRIVGRGQGSGRGTTAGKGNKGQQSRSGGKTYLGFEGGQMPLYRRLAQRGFSNYPFKTVYQPINVCDIEKHFEDGAVVDIVSLRAVGLVKGRNTVAKILGGGELTKKINCKITSLSVSAKEKIVKAGGSVDGASEPSESAETQ
jgi:large subunit ribosomal protein L15